MKTRNLIKYMLTMVLVCMGTMPLMAQKNIDKLAKELEERDDVSINSVIQRDPKTRKVTRIVKTFSVKENGIAKRLIEAFEKDEEYTITAIKDMPRGRKEATRVNFTFIFQKGNEKSTYTLSTDNNGTVSMSIIFKPENEGKDNVSYLFPNGSILYNINELECQGLTKEQQKQLEKQMEQLRKALKGKLNGLHISEK